MGQGLFGGGHHAVIGGDHQHGDIGALRATRTHRGEGFMARSIQEGDLAATVLDLVRADMLGDAARFALLNMGATDHIQQRRLAVVNVAQDGHNRRAGLQALRRLCVVEMAPLGEIGLLGFLDFRSDRVGLISHFLDDDRRRVVIDLLVDRRHNPVVDELLHDIDRAGADQLGQITHTQIVGNLEDLFLFSHKHLHAYCSGNGWLAYSDFFT